MKRTQSLIALRAVLVVAAPQVSFADHSYNGHYGGGVSWWWVFPPLIFLITLPAFRFPDPQSVIILQPAPIAVVQPRVSAVRQQVAVPQAAQYRFYCPDSNNYDPYGRACPSG
jgi:hypothetical protein